MSSTRPGDDLSPWTRPGFIASGALLLALVVAAIVIAITNNGSSNSQRAVHAARPTAAAATPPTTTAVAPATTNTSSCSLPAGSQTIPATSPPIAAWETVGSMQVPQAPSTLGPQHTNGIWNTCFARSPSGALLAALNFYGEGTAATEGALFAHLAVDYPAAAAAGPKLDAHGPVQFAGYRYGSYTPTQAVIQVALQGQYGRLVAVVTDMEWSGSDWRFTTASANASMAVIPDLTGYVPWSDF